MNIARRMRRLSRAGFTLIELLTVIAIIGILAAILIPTIGKVRATAKSVKCASNLRQIGIANRLFASDHKDFIALGGNGRWWGDDLAPYLLGTNKANNGEYTDNEKNVFNCPAKITTDMPSYGYNNFTLHTNWLYLFSKPLYPSSTILMGDMKEGVSTSYIRPNNDAQSLQAGWVLPVDAERHGGTKANFVFFDASVKSLTVAETEGTGAVGTSYWRWW